MKIAYVVKRYPRLSETFIVNEILAHEASGGEVDIFALLPPEDTHFQDLISRVRGPVTYLPFGNPTATELWSAINVAGEANRQIWQALCGAKDQQIQLIYQALALAKHVHQRHITHLHAHFAAIATSVTRLAAHFASISYSFTAHARDIFHNTVDPADLKLKLLDAHSVVTVSDYNVRHLRSLHTEGFPRIRRINYGLDLTRFTYISPEVRSRTIIAVGRLVEKKGFCVLLEACAVLAVKGCSFNCQIIGGGGLRDSLQNKIEQLGIQKYVTMLGPRSQHEVIQYVQQASVMVAPCVIAKDGDRDGLPNVLIEAMALGTPCISTNIVGIPELVVHRKTGLTVEPFDVCALADSIELLLNDGKLRVDLSSAARQFVESDFNIVHNSAQLRQLFAACQEKRTNH